MNDKQKPLILVVEDEPLILLATQDLLEDAGYRVLTAANAADAIACLEGHPDIRLVFSDIDMPGAMNGLALVACVRDRWPPIAIILTSGHQRPSEESMPTGAEFFAKPYSNRLLSNAIERLTA